MSDSTSVDSGLPPSPEITAFGKEVDVIALLPWLERDCRSSTFQFAQILRINGIKTVKVFSPGGTRFMIELPNGIALGDYADILDRVRDSKKLVKIFDTPLPDCLKLSA